jgi:hypothetical protein
MVDFDLPSFLFPAESFQAGQVVQIRVEAHDRVARPDQFLACGQAQPQPLLCEPRPGCNGWVTWTVDIQ